MFAAREIPLGKINAILMNAPKHLPKIFHNIDVINLFLLLLRGVEGKLNSRNSISSCPINSSVFLFQFNSCLSGIFNVSLFVTTF